MQPHWLSYLVDAKLAWAKQHKPKSHWGSPTQLVDLSVWKTDYHSDTDRDADDNANSDHVANSYSNANIHGYRNGNADHPANGFCNTNINGYRSGNTNHTANGFRNANTNGHGKAESIVLALACQAMTRQPGQLAGTVRRHGRRGSFCGSGAWVLA